jgi:DNA-binding transcriptional ArsR family regulator
MNEMFETLADPTRRRIIEALLGGEQAVNELVARVDIQQPGVSRHLRILTAAGFVRARPAGTQRLYSLRGEPFRELADWASRYRGLWEGRLDRFGRELEHRRTAHGARVPAGRKHAKR